RNVGIQLTFEDTTTALGQQQDQQQHFNIPRSTRGDKELQVDHHRVRPQERAKPT
ncbi:unnamed protein product, partial [Amoebophrya sp. A120]